MIQRRTKLSMLLIILLACLTTFIYKFTDEASIVISPNIEFIASNNQIIKSTAKDKKITIPNTVNTLEGTSNKDALMIVIKRPKWKFDENLIVQFEKLKRAAANGDNEASYILSKNLSYCFSSPTDDTALDQKLEQAYDFSDSELAVSRITEKYEYCSGIEQKQRNKFYSYSEVAANNGYVAAQEFIGSITPEFFMESQDYKNLEREEFIKMRDNFVEQQIGFLQQAAQNGSIEALARLSRMNRLQKFGENGYVKASAFNQLILELTQNNDLYNRYSRAQKKLHSQLTLEEVDRAFAMSEEWLEIIKANGTLYLKRN